MRRAPCCQGPIPSREAQSGPQGRVSAIAAGARPSPHRTRLSFTLDMHKSRRPLEIGYSTSGTEYCSTYLLCRCSETVEYHDCSESFLGHIGTGRVGHRDQSIHELCLPRHLGSKLVHTIVATASGINTGKIRGLCAESQRNGGWQVTHRSHSLATLKHRPQNRSRATQWRSPPLSLQCLHLLPQLLDLH